MVVAGCSPELTTKTIRAALTPWHLKGDWTRLQPIRDIQTSFFSDSKMFRIPSQTLAVPLLTFGWTTCLARNPSTSALATKMDQIKLELIESIFAPETPS